MVPTKESNPPSTFAAGPLQGHLANPPSTFAAGPLQGHLASITSPDKSPAVRPNERPVCLPMDRQHGTCVPGQLPPRASRALRSLHWLVVSSLAGPSAGWQCRSSCTAPCGYRLGMSRRRGPATVGAESRLASPLHTALATVGAQQCTTVTTMLACPVNSCRHPDGRHFVCFPRLVKPCEERQAAFIDGSAVCLSFHLSVVGVLQCSGS